VLTSNSRGVWKSSFTSCSHSCSKGLHRVLYSQYENYQCSERLISDSRIRGIFEPHPAPGPIHQNYEGQRAFTKGEAQVCRRMLDLSSSDSNPSSLLSQSSASAWRVKCRSQVRLNCCLERLDPRTAAMGSNRRAIDSVNWTKLCSER